MITPAISVLSAVEGLNVCNARFRTLRPGQSPSPADGTFFTIQFKGASGVGVIFGPS